MPEGSSELTARQRAVVERIERRVPIKTIAAELGISPTRVNQHVRAVKDLYGVNSLGELVENFRQDGDETIHGDGTFDGEVGDDGAGGDEPSCDDASGGNRPFAAENQFLGHPFSAARASEKPCETGTFVPLTIDALPKDQFPPSAPSRENRVQDESVEFAFSDALSFPLEAPWTRQAEPVVVPGMLDGHHFVTARLLAMMGAAVGMMSLFVLVLTSFLSLSQMLEGRWYVPEDHTARAIEHGGGGEFRCSIGSIRTLGKSESSCARLKRWVTKC